MSTDMLSIASGELPASRVIIDSLGEELSFSEERPLPPQNDPSKTNRVWSYVSELFSAKTLHATCLTIGRLPLRLFSLVEQVFLAVYSVFSSGKTRHGEEMEPQSLASPRVEHPQTNSLPIFALPMDPDTLLTAFFTGEDDLSDKSAQELRDLLKAKDLSVATLVEMDVDDKKLDALPPEIRFLKLKELTLRKNQFTIFPEEVFSLRGTLESLDLSQNFIVQLPHQISDLVLLRELSVSFNRLETIPKEIGALRLLETLHLENNQLKALPDVFDFFGQLKQVHVGLNQLRELPPSLCTCTTLENLFCEENTLVRLPEAIGALRALKELILCGNELKNLAPSIQYMAALRCLNVARNQLSSLPDLDGMESLSLLNISGNQFQNFPQQLMKLPKLATLDISHNPLDKCPEELFKMSSLMKVYVDEEQFTRWSAAIDAFEKNGPTKEITFCLGGEYARELRKVMVRPGRDSLVPKEEPLPPPPNRRPPMPAIDPSTLQKEPLAPVLNPSLIMSSEQAAPRKLGFVLGAQRQRLNLGNGKK